MAPKRVLADKHFPAFALDNPLRALSSSRHEFNRYVSAGQVAADLGCGPGYFTLALADAVGPQGIVYAVDSDPKAIAAVQRKAVRRGYTNVDARAVSASELGFIPDASVDFILAEGLLCSIAQAARDACVRELHRILKPAGRAYLAAGRGSWSYMTDAAWEEILRGWQVEWRTAAAARGDYLAVVTLRA